MIVVFGVLAIDKKIDDPVGALSAHGLAGIWGTLACGLFTAPRLAEKNAVGERPAYTAALHAARLRQAVGVAVAVLRVRHAACFDQAIWRPQADLRPSRSACPTTSRSGRFREDVRHCAVIRETERWTPALGALPSTGMYGYPVSSSSRLAELVGHASGAQAFEPIRMELLEDRLPVPVDLQRSRARDVRGKGSGRQKGITERYRGAELTNWLRPKVKLECVVASGDVQTVVDAILKHARTGSIGDGKVFILPVEEAYRIRTGESGEETLQAHPGVAAQAAS